MPSAAANGKSEKQVSSETQDNSPLRQIVTVIEHKIRNLEKRKVKLTSYRDLQKTGKELNADQKVAVAKYDEVAQTLEFARDISKQVSVIVTAAERDAKKQAKKDAWARYAAETNKIRETLLILDCLTQMGNTEAREDFLKGENGAAKLTSEDLRILDELYPEVTPKHEINEEGQPGFHSNTIKASEHLYSIIDGKPKEVLGTTYAHIKEIVNIIHECGYFDKDPEATANTAIEDGQVEAVEAEQENPVETMHTPTFVPQNLPIPPAATIVPAPAYPLRPLPPITLQEVEHAYFSQQYPQSRPITEVIGSQNFFFIQDSEIDSPIGTPQPPPILGQPSPPGAIPTQTFTNQHFVPMPPQPHFPAHPEHAFTAVSMVVHPPVHQQQQATPPMPEPQAPAVPTPPPAEEPETSTLNNNDDEWKQEKESPERNDATEKAQGDGQKNFRRYGRNNGRGSSNGFRGRGSYRQNNEGYRSNNEGYRQNNEGYRPKQYNDNYHRHGKDGYQSRGGSNGYYGNGDFDHQHSESSGRERYGDSYQGGFKSRGRGGRGGAGRGTGAGRPPRTQYTRRTDHAD